MREFIFNPVTIIGLVILASAIVAALWSNLSRPKYIRRERTADGMKFGVGDRVLKDSGDYRYEGEVVSVFAKRSGVVRLVVENDDGMLFIFNENQLKPVSE